MLRRALLLLVALLLASCGDDGPGAGDAGAVDAVAVDAAGIDAEPDAFDPCPGASTVAFGVVDWETNENLAGVKVEEIDTGKSATSAPNGRVVLCAETASGLLNLRLSKADYLDRLHATTVAIARDQFATGGVQQYRMLTAAAADSLYASVGQTRSAGASTLIALVHDTQTGNDLAGVSANTTANNGGSFVPGAGALTLSAGGTTDASGRLLFLNAEVGAGSTSLTATNCAGPESASLEAGSISSASLACPQPL